MVELPEDDPNANLWQALAEAYRSGKPPTYTGEKALRDVRILEAVDQALLHNQVMAVA